MKRHALDTRVDKFAEKIKIDDQEIDIADFVKELNKLTEQQLNFKQTVHQFIETNDLRDQTKKALLKALD